MTAKKRAKSTIDPKRRNAWILVSVASVLLAVVAIVGLILLASGGPTDDPTAAARRFAELYQRGLNSSGRDVDVNDFESVVCSAVMPQLKEAFSEKENPVPGTPQFKLTVKDVQTNGDKGSFKVDTEVTAPGNEKQNDEETFQLVMESRGWRVCGL